MVYFKPTAVCTMHTTVLQCYSTTVRRCLLAANKVSATGRGGEATSHHERVDDGAISSISE